MKSSILIAIAAVISVASSRLLPRQAAPLFANVNAVFNGEFQKVSLADYKDKYVVLLFYPFDFTYVCPTELIAFSDSIAKFQELNTVVLGISTDSHFTHLAWLKTKREDGGIESLTYPLLADISKEISRRYGVLVEDREDELFGAALRGLYIIDGKGKVRTV